MKRIKRYMWFLPPAVLMLTVLLLSLKMYWQGDAVTFGFFIPAENEDFSSIPFTSVSEIPESMKNHYFNSTGRFFSHGITQFFCAFAGKGWFAVFNAIFWGAFIFMLSKLASADIRNPRVSFIASFFTFLLFFPFSSEQSFPFEPPHQIDYVWMGVLSMVWVYAFFKKSDAKKFPILFLLGLLSVIAGVCNEAMSIPIGGAIIVFAIIKRFRLTPAQWMMSVLYGISALFEILAPANFQRMSSGWSLMHTFENLLPSLVIPACWLFVLFFFKSKRIANTENQYSIFLWATIIINYIVGIYLGMGSGSRMLTIANAFFIVLIIKDLDGKRPHILGFALLSILFLLLAGYRFFSITRLNDKNILIEKSYHESKDGVVTLPDSIYFYEYRSFVVRPHPYMMKERALYPDKPNIRIRPASMESLDLSKDTNMLIKIGPQRWIMIRSKKSPADFFIEKNLLPWLSGKKLPTRKIDWDLINSETVIDSTELWKAAVYENDRPYIISNIYMSR